MPTVVLVHGFWHGSWCWSPVTEQLAARDIPSVAVDLQGHGLKSRSPLSRWRRPFDPAALATEPSAVGSVTASSAAAELVEQIRVIGGGEPCIVVAHSMGGTVATAAAELEPSLFACLVYVAAFAPAAGKAAAEYSLMPENEGETYSSLLRADPEAVGAARLDLDDMSSHPAIRETFYADVDEDTAQAAISLLTPDGPLGIPAETFPVTTARYGSVPHAYVVCTQDNALPVALQRLFIEEIDAVSATPTAVTEFDTSHSPFLSRPKDLAAVIADVCRMGPVSG